MSTNYPGGIDSYTVKQDGIDTVAAEHINNLQDAVVAVQTELGTNPKGGFSNVGTALAAKLSTTGGHLTGNITCSPGVAIDGVDISTHDHSGGAAGSQILELLNARENSYNLLDNLARRQSDWVHNSVNSSSVNSQGLPDYITAGTGLAVNINGGGGWPLIEMDIAGFYQRIESTILVDQLTPSATNYIYAEKSQQGLTPNLGHVTLQPVYAYTPPGAPSVDQHWYNIAQGGMKRWNGSFWEDVMRIFIAEIDTGETEVDEFEIYALKGRFESDWFAVSANTQYDMDHMLGMPPLEVTLFGATDAAGSQCHKVGYYNDGTYGYGGMVWDIGNLSLLINDDTSGFDYPIRYGASAASASGYYKFYANRGW